MYPYSTAFRQQQQASNTLPTLMNQSPQYYAPQSYLFGRSPLPASTARLSPTALTVPRNPAAVPPPSPTGGMDVLAPFSNMFRGLIDRANQVTQNAANAIQQNGLTVQPPGAGAGAGGGAGKPKSNRDVMHEQIDGKLGAGWVERFSQAHGMSPLEFYANPNNWFPYQEDAAKDYGTDSPQFWNATQRATVEEGMKHAQEAAQWQQLHGNTPIPPEMWDHWFYVNRYGNPNNEPVVW